MVKKSDNVTVKMDGHYFTFRPRNTSFLNKPIRLFQ